MSSTSPAPVSEEEARDLVNRWAATGFYRLRNMGDKIFVDEIVRGWAYTARLQTHYEQRRVTRAQEPYHGGPVDEHGRAPGKWDVAIARPRDFQERTETVTVPHTERVEVCATCGGQGQMVCPLCGGSGQTACPLCGGTGVRLLQVMDTDRGPHGEMISMPRTVQQHCVCRGGRIRCPGCGGSGRQTCGDCRGSGQVKTFDRLVVRFLQSRHGELIDVTPVPDNWFGHLSGEMMAEERGPRIESFNPVNDDIDERARKLLERSHDVDEARTRILLQHLRIERIPLHEVRYRYAGVERKLWICGNEKDIYAPEAPWNRSRLYGTVLGSILAGVVVIGLVVWLLFVFR
jgi:hypothetical protein